MWEEAGAEILLRSVAFIERSLCTKCRTRRASHKVDGTKQSCARVGVFEEVMFEGGAAKAKSLPESKLGGGVEAGSLRKPKAGPNGTRSLLDRCVCGGIAFSISPLPRLIPLIRSSLLYVLFLRKRRFSHWKVLLLVRSSDSGSSLVVQGAKTCVR
jgi:hypothetical protein